MKNFRRLIVSSLLLTITVLALGCGKDNPSQPGPNVAPETPPPPMGGGTFKPKNVNPGK